MYVGENSYEGANGLLIGSEQGLWLVFLNTIMNVSVP
jgi:hypothetical protein